MFRAPNTKTHTRTLFAMTEVTYHSIVRNLRSGHRNAVVGLALTTLQSLVMVGVFLLMFTLWGCARHRLGVISCCSSCPASFFT